MGLNSCDQHDPLERLEDGNRLIVGADEASEPARLVDDLPIRLAPATSRKRCHLGTGSEQASRDPRSANTPGSLRAPENNPVSLEGRRRELGHFVTQCLEPASYLRLVSSDLR